MKVYVNYNDARWRKYNIDFAGIANAAAVHVAPGAEVSITLTNDSEMQRINRQYRGIDKPTNVLSFELGDDILLGDIYISLETVMHESDAENISVAEHTAHMVVHGMLHLQGYDHIKNSDARKMEQAEVKILENIGIKNPYAPESGVCNDLSCCPGQGFLSWIRRLKIRQGGVVQFILMFLLGAIASLGFAPFNMWWATIFAIAFAYWLVIRGNVRRSFWRTFVVAAPFGAAYALAMFWWVVNSIYVVPELAAQFAIWTVPALIGIALVGAVIFSVPFIAVMRMRTVPACRPFVFACTWTLILWMREWLLTGFPWNPVANIMLEFAPLANSMSLWGALGLTFVIVGFAASVVDVISSRHDRLRWITFGIFIALGIGGGIAGYLNIAYSKADSAKTPVVRIVQPARSASQKATHSRDAALRNAMDNMDVLAALGGANGNPDLIVFPETSYPFVIINGDDMPLARALGADVIIGATTYTNGRMYNSLIVANENGVITHVYSKSHLVPFGEYRPFGDIIPTPGQLSHGNGAEVVSINPNGHSFVFAPAICYEIVFSDSLIPRGTNADAIINITNDTWFGNTPGTYQHLDMVRRYAIESGLPIIRANYSGISAFVNADGVVVSSIPVAHSGYADGVVSGAHNTPYRIIGRDWWMVIILLFSCMCTISLYCAARRK